MSDTLHMRITSSLSFAAGVRFPMPLQHAGWNAVRRLAWRLYGDLVTLTFMVEIVSLMTNWGLNPNDLGTFCASFGATGYLLHYLFKTTIFERSERLFVGLFHELKDISDELHNNPFARDYLAFYDGHYLPIIRTALLKGSLELVGAVGLFILFIVKSWVLGVPEDLVTPGMSWVPYDNSENPVYSLTCIFEMVVFGTATMRNAVLDLVFWHMLFVPVIQLRYLDRLLEGMISARANDEEPKMILNDEFVWWIRCHQRILRVIQEFRTISSPYLAVNYCTTLFILSLGGLLAISSTSWTIFQKIIINAILVSNVVQLYFVSLTGDFINESSENVAQGAFTGDLIHGDRALRKNYLFVCARSRHSLQIRFGGINPLSSHTFGQLIRLTLTYFVTVVQIRDS